jgi:integrase
MPLKQFEITKAAPKNKPYKLADGAGLHLLVNPNGSKLWRYRYEFAGREKLLSFGSFPETGLAQARDKRYEARKLLDEGLDPSIKRKLDKAVAATTTRNTFGLVAEEYIENLVAKGAAESTVSKNKWLLQDLARPLANRPVGQIIPVEILELLKRIEKTGRRETARRLRGIMGSVFRYAIVTQRATVDPTVPLYGALVPPKVKHRAAIVDERELGILLCSIDDYDGWPTIRAALQLLVLTMTRPGDIRGMKRSEIDFGRAVWRIPAERMKMRRPHDVPLSTQALAILKDIWPVSERGELVLPSVRSVTKPLSEGAMIAALRRMGYTTDQISPHGFRSAASTILNERGFHPDVIEAALAHQDPNDIRRAYNRATYWPERIKLLQSWADLVDEFKQQSVEKHRAA